MRYEKCLVEVDEVLKYLVEEDLIKIPEDIRKAISENKDKEYIWYYDETKNLNEQNLSRGTIAILSYLNIEYLLNEEQKKLMKEIHKYNEKIKSNQTNQYSFNKVSDNTVINTEKEKVELVEVKKQKWYEKIILFFRNMFNK